MNLTLSSQIKRGLTLCVVLFFLNQIFYAQLPSGFTDVKIQGGYDMPMGVIFSKNGQKMFVWEKKGILWVSNWNGSTFQKQSTPVLDMREEVGDWSDLGLHSVCLDPNFDSNGKIYLFYQVDRHHLINFGTPAYSPTKDEYFDATISRVTRYTVNTSTMIADKNSRKVLIGESKNTGIPVLHQSHAGGQLIFGTDGTLLISTGDGSSFNGADVGSASETYYQKAINDGIIRSTEDVGAFRAQQINSHGGKILRIDPSTGDAIVSNPYYDSGRPRSAQSRVWALGLRNPYRIALKTDTGSSNPGSGNPGTILVCDVQAGGNEELNIIEKAGVNCGWPVFEGIVRQNAFTDKGTRNQEESGSPTFESLCKLPTSASVNSSVSQRRFTFFPPALEWSHNENRTRYPDFSSGSLQAKIIGSGGALVAGSSFSGACGTSGSYYTGNAFPSKYRNVFFFGDYVGNWIKAVSIHDNSDHQIHEVLDFAPNGYTDGVVDIEYCPVDESLVYVNINTGDIKKINFGGNGNRSPVAKATANKTGGASPLTVNFTGNQSSDPDGDPLSYEWDFGDGSTSNSANPSHTFTSSGSRGFTVKLKVSDNKGLSDATSLAISTNNTPPSVKITNPANNSKYTLSQASNITLKASVTDNDASNMKYAWQVTLKHNTHEHREPINTQQSPTVTISPVGCDGESYSYLIELTVTDNGGLSAKDAVTILPDCSSGRLSVTNIKAIGQQNAAQVTWTNPPVSFDEVMVVAKENSGFSGSPSGTSYSASSSFTGGGSSFEGGKVVYKGTRTSVTVTNLSGNIKYYFRAFARKGNSWSGGIETSATPSSSGNAPISPIPSSEFDPNKCYKISTFRGGNVMEVQSRSTSSGAPIQLGSYGSGLKHQLWRIKANGDGTHRLMNANSGKVADVKADRKTSGTAIQQYGWNSGDNQRWTLKRNSAGYYMMIAKHSGLLIDIYNNDYKDGVPLVQKPEDGTSSQLWKIESVGCPSGVFSLLSDNILWAEGYKDGKNAVINWISNANKNKDYFVVEKFNEISAEFEQLDVINANNTLIGNSTYTFTDNDPGLDNNRYRIVLYRDDTTPPQYSEVITLNFKDLKGFVVFPNPAQDYLDINLEDAGQKSVEIAITNVTGQIVKQKKLEFAPKAPVRMFLDGLEEGSYLIRIKADGKREMVKQFVIMR